jgi:phenylacetic acid degradation operon negative regulatory protein
VVLSVLLGSDPPRLPTQLLVRTTELFGIAEGTTRTALSRMVGSGELVATDGRHELAGDRLVARQARQAESREARTGTWRGRRWRVAVLGVDGPRDRADRAEVRAQLVAARLAELREGVWLRPDNLPTPEIDGAHTFLADPVGDPAALATGLWDLDGWAAEAFDLRRRMDELVGRLLDGDTSALRDGFVLSADVLRHFQHDPLLPAELLPEGWPGAALRAEYDRYDAAYRRVIATWFGRNRR